MANVRTSFSYRFTDRNRALAFIDEVERGCYVRDWELYPSSYGNYIVIIEFCNSDMLKKDLFHARSCWKNLK